MTTAAERAERERVKKLAEFLAATYWNGLHRVGNVPGPADVEIFASAEQYAHNRGKDWEATARLALELID